MMSRNSTTEPGQPCVMISGIASGSAERTCRKCTRAPSIVVTNWPNPFSRASCTRQSYPSRQYEASSRTYSSGMP